MEQIRLKRVLDNKQAAKLKTKYLDKKHYTKLITSDADGYDYNTGQLLFKFRKSAIPFELLKQGAKAFENSIELTESRGAASGSSHKRIRKDGSISNITVGNKVESGSVGYMDKNAMVHYCRKTAFAKKYFDEFTSGIPFVKFVDQKI